MFAADIYVGEKVPDYAAIAANATGDNVDVTTDAYNYVTTEAANTLNATNDTASGRSAGRREKVTSAYIYSKNIME